MNQFHIYKTFFQANKNKDSTLHNLLDKIPVERFLIIFKLVRIAVTLPVTSCEPERCFSAMKTLKPRGRSTMIDDRLDGSALTYIHPNVNIEPEIVVNAFAVAKRKLELAL